MIGTVAQFTTLLDRLAPPHLAESWDNVGLQIGHPEWPVKKVWTALDPLPEVVQRAGENDVDLLVTHHPLIFKPLRRIDGRTPVGRIVEMAFSRRVAIFSAHTNLDSVPGGLNDALAERIGLDRLRVLGTPADVEMHKLVVFVPDDHVGGVLKALFDIQAGRIGRYSCCTFRCPGTGTFLPDDAAHPAIGETGSLNEVSEQRLELVVPRVDLERVVATLKTAHPYETMAYDLYPLAQAESHSGIGRVGRMPSKVSLQDFAAGLKTEFNLAGVKVVGDPQMRVDTVAVCSGSGASLLPAAIASGAQVYVSGDLGYHTARDAQQAGLGLIDIGHFGSEHLVAGLLAASIRAGIDAAGLTAVVEAVETETDPFHYL